MYRFFQGKNPENSHRERKYQIGNSPGRFPREKRIDVQCKMKFSTPKKNHHMSLKSVLWLKEDLTVNLGMQGYCLNTVRRSLVCFCFFFKKIMYVIPVVLDSISVVHQPKVTISTAKFLGPMLYPSPTPFSAVPKKRVYMSGWKRP